jgi:hypothetical protein
MGQKSLFNRVPSPSQTVNSEGLTLKIRNSRKKIITPVKERDNVIVHIDKVDELIINNELIPDIQEEE